MKDDPEWATTDEKEETGLKSNGGQSLKLDLLLIQIFSLNGMRKVDDEKFCVVLRADEQCACRTRMKMVIEPGGRLQ